MQTLMFPGQGSQFKGMRKALFEADPALTRQASDILGYAIDELCLADPRNQLGQTEYTQPALYVVNALAWRRHVDTSGPAVDFLAGHSLGEYNALLAAGAFDFATGLRLVQKRGQLMGRASGGGMLAVLQVKLDDLQNALRDGRIDTLDIANYNTPTQIILSGPRADIARAEAVFATRNMRCIALNVSAAFHSRYMRDAMAEFEAFLQSFRFAPLKVPVIANVTARPYGDGQVAALLARQIAGSVLWNESIRYLMGRSADMKFVELGASPVLARMVTEIQKTQTPLVDAPLAKQESHVKRNRIREQIAVKSAQLTRHVQMKTWLEAYWPVNAGLSTCMASSWTYLCHQIPSTQVFTHLREQLLAQLMLVEKALEFEHRGRIGNGLNAKLGLTAVSTLLATLGLTPRKPLQRACQCDPEAIEKWQREIYPASAQQAKRQKAEVLFWDESGYRADTVHGKTWGVRGPTPVVQRPGQRKSVSAASAVNANGAFWFCTYKGALTAKLFVNQLKQMMKGRRKPVHMIVDGLPAHKKACVPDYTKSTQGRLTLHFLPGYAPDLNPDEMVWSHIKRTGTARRPLQKGDSLRERIEEQLEMLMKIPQLVHSFSRSFYRLYDGLRIKS